MRWSDLSYRDSKCPPILIWPPNFAPSEWALCAGQLLAISQNTALFSLLGTTYGGNGTSTFGSPGLRGRVPLGAGQGPGLSSYFPGELGGVESVALTSRTSRSSGPSLGKKLIGTPTSFHNITESLNC
jgi:microcystin-dependent protein